MQPIVTDDRWQGAYGIWYMVYGIWYIGCAARERLGIEFLAAPATSKQTAQFFSLNADTGFLRFKE